jgi:hypothetical protein
MPKYPLPGDEFDQRPGLHPPQFGLSAFLCLFAVLALSMFAFRTVGPLMATAILLLAAAVGAHVMGNALGTRLRDQVGVPQRDRRLTGRVTVAQAHHFAPTTKLSKRRRQIGWVIIAMSLVGAMAGATLGGILLSRVNADRMTGANLAVAVGSCGVLGGLGGFACFGFARVSFQAWWQAHRES